MSASGRSGRRQVSGAAKTACPPALLGALLLGLGQAEVAELAGGRIRDEHVIGLEIAVDDGFPASVLALVEPAARVHARAHARRLSRS